MHLQPPTVTKKNPAFLLLLFLPSSFQQHRLPDFLGGENKKEEEEEENSDLNYKYRKKRKEKGNDAIIMLSCDPEPHLFYLNNDL